MINAILETSVLPAWARGEHHDVDADKLLSSAAVSAISLADFRAKLIDRQVPAEDVEESLRDFNLTILPFGPAEAVVAGTFIPIARPLNIGFGDCACIATGLVAGLTVWTADLDWAKLDIDARLN